MKALRFARAVSDPATGRYGRDGAGNFTGMLHGSVGELIDKQLPPFSHAQALIGARGVAKDLNRVGITSIHDMTRVDEVSRQQLYHANVERSFTDVRIFRDLRERGELTLRVYAILPIRSWSGAVSQGIRPHGGDAWLSFGALKDLADNGFMRQPYANNPDYRGGWTFRMIDEAFAEKQIVEADRAGFDMTTHVIGDHALLQDARLVRSGDPGQRSASGPPHAPHPPLLSRPGRPRPRRAHGARGRRAAHLPRRAVVDARTRCSGPSVPAGRMPGAR